MKIVQFLLDNDADLNIKNNRGITPKDLLKYVDDEKIKDLINKSLSQYYII